MSKSLRKITTLRLISDKINLPAECNIIKSFDLDDF